MAIGHRLPGEYRDFLKVCGGGFSGVQPSYHWQNGEWAGRVHTIGGLRDDEDDFSLQVQNRTPTWRLPNDFLWIMRDHGGNPIGISLYGPSAGGIFFLDHEVEPEEDWSDLIADAQDLDYALRLAPSFSDFVARVSTN